MEQETLEVLRDVEKAHWTTAHRLASEPRRREADSFERIVYAALTLKAEGPSKDLTEVKLREMCFRHLMWYGSK